MFPGPEEQNGPECRVCGCADVFGEMLVPCRCIGPDEHVHRECLDRWRVLSPHANSVSECETCGARYRVAMVHEHARTHRLLGAWLRVLFVVLGECAVYATAVNVFELFTFVMFLALTPHSLVEAYALSWIVYAGVFVGASVLIGAIDLFIVCFVRPARPLSREYFHGGADALWWAVPLESRSGPTVNAVLVCTNILWFAGLVPMCIIYAHARRMWRKNAVKIWEVVDRADS